MRACGTAPPQLSAAIEPRGDGETRPSLAGSRSGASLIYPLHEIKNTSESDPRSYEVTLEAVTNKAQKIILRLYIHIIPCHSPHITGINCNCFNKLLHNCEGYFPLHSLSAVHSYDLYHTHIISFSSYKGYKLNSHLTCFQRGFIAQLVEHHTGIVEVMGSNPLGASELFPGLYL